MFDSDANEHWAVSYFVLLRPCQSSALHWVLSHLYQKRIQSFISKWLLWLLQCLLVHRFGPTTLLFWFISTAEVKQRPLRQYQKAVESNLQLAKAVKCLSRRLSCRREWCHHQGVYSVSNNVSVDGVCQRNMCMNARIQSFPPQHCILTRWSFLLTTRGISFGPSGLFCCPQVAKYQSDCWRCKCVLLLLYPFGARLTFFSCVAHSSCTWVVEYWLWLAERNIILIGVVRSTLNVDTHNSFCTHNADSQHTNQASSALSHAPFPAILDEDLTFQLGQIESGGLPPAHASLCALLVFAARRAQLPVQVFVPTWSRCERWEWETELISFTVW